MKEKISFVFHNGVRVIISDYSGLTGDAFNSCIHRHNEEIWTAIIDGERDIRFLTDVTGTSADRETVRILKDTSAKHLPYTKKSAVVGVAGIQKVLLQAINMFSDLKTVPFDSVEEAMDWLARD